MSRLWAAVAIGGTKSSVALARDAGDDAFDWIGTSHIPTCADAAHTLTQLTDALAGQLAAADAGPDRAGTDGSGPDGTAPRLAGIGIVCGSPLDEQAGWCSRRPTCRGGPQSTC